MLAASVLLLNVTSDLYASCLCPASRVTAVIGVTIHLVSFKVSEI